MKQFAWAAIAALLGSAPAFASTSFKYECYPTDTAMNKESLVVTPRTITLSGHKLHLDSKFKPRINKDYNRYTGDTSFLTSESYEIMVLVNKSAIKGVNKTSMKIMARGEGFFNTFYNCWSRN